MRVAWAGVLGLACTFAHAADNWTPLFDGKSLQGWKQVNGTAKYEVADGAIVGITRTGTPNSFLATEKTYGDFVLELEFRQDGVPANSGVQIRSSSRPEFKEGRVFGYQIDIDPAPRRWNGGIYEEVGRGWLYPGSLNPASLAYFKPGEWNRMRIEAIGGHLRTWINGQPVSHVIDDGIRDGFIALQVHSVEKEEEAGVRTSWRNLRICESCSLSPPETSIFVRNTRANVLDDIERAQGWRLLWDGSTSRGWQSATGGSFPARGWTMDRGELVVSGGGGDIVTTEEFGGAFELQLEFKLTAGANSGIKYLVMQESGGNERVGLEYQLLDDARHPDAKQGADGNRTLASLYDLHPRASLMTNVGIQPQVGEWQHARIVVGADNRVEHWLNGVKVLDYVRGSEDFRSRVARSKFAKVPGFGTTAKGPILLQDHGDEVRFRSIKIRTR